MDKPLNDLDWNQVRALLATVEAGSLSAAARRLGLTQPTLGRQVAALERDLGVTLFERVGRSLVLTQAGQELIEPLRAMGSAADRIALVASRQSQDIDGLVRITASDVYAHFILPEVVARLRQMAPGIVIEVVASNEVEDLIRRKADIAIRHVPPREAELIARRCPDTTARLYAAPDYLDTLGTPFNSAALSRADFIGFSDSTAIMLAELRRHGLTLSERNFPLLSNSGLVAWGWVAQGLGIGVMMAPVAQATPGIVDAWPGFDGIPIPTWLATHRELRTSRRIRLVFDVLAEHLTALERPKAP
ncbi:LysR family transcriptional regulator [Devosia sp. FKR38]|uniref:LysR family transcriptional regulator n=1 Tax=Devosia sp. FKR38 TaxID=2562312 RepID=UPI0010C0BCE2|nr:LysR family transcriptional regulator [Devosia sp. FKR38]